MIVILAGPPLLRGKADAARNDFYCWSTAGSRFLVDRLQLCCPNDSPWFLNNGIDGRALRDNYAIRRPLQTSARDAGRLKSTPAGANEQHNQQIESSP